MATTDTNLADRSGNLLESHKNYDPRLILFYFLTAALLLTLVGGLAYEQIFETLIHESREREQNQRRVIVPGPRGNIYDRNGQLLVGNQPRFSVVLHLDELRPELRDEYDRIKHNYVAAGGRKEMPTPGELSQITRVSVVQRYLDQVNRILRRDSQIDANAIKRHFQSELRVPFTFIDDLSPEDYARLLERLPVNSPVQVYSSSRRFYPHNSLAAHTLGYVRPGADATAADLPGADIRTTPMKGTIGMDGLEKQFDSVLQGKSGVSIFRVDPAGYKVNKPIISRQPVQGKDLITSLDLDLQLAAEETLGDQIGAAVAIDVATGEVLVLASKPDYNLAEFSPRATNEVVAKMTEQRAWVNFALNGFWPPGSTFKILTSIAGLRSGVLTPDDDIVDCQGTIRIGGSQFVCSNGHGHHGKILLNDAIAQSCDIYFNIAGTLIAPQTLAAEARRFHLDQRTGIELPGEENRMIIPDPEWKKRKKGEAWYPGDGALTAMGQGFVVVTPLQMACFAASVARNEVFTQPTLLHDENRPRQHSESIGLTSAQRAALIEGMEGCLIPPHGTARTLSLPQNRIPNVRIAGKTGTAQKDVTIDGKKGKINYAWFICFAPVENPRIAVAVAIEGETLDEEFGGGFHAGPVANAVLKKYFEKEKLAASPLFSPLKAP